MNDLSYFNLLNQVPGYIGWKDTHFRHMGCNSQLGNILQLSSNKIVGLLDEDLVDQTEDSCKFHRKNDLLVLNGKTIQGIHKSSPPYNGNLFYFVKKPLFDIENNIIGLIYTCQELEKNSKLEKLIHYDKKFISKKSSYLHYQLQQEENVYQLSQREMECLFLILRGKNAIQIASILNLSKRTIEFYIENIKNKFGCNTKAELILLAIEKDYLNIIPSRFLQNNFQVFID